MLDQRPDFALCLLADQHLDMTEVTAEALLLAQQQKMPRRRDELLVKLATGPGGILLITGGALGMVSAPIGQWWIERAGLIGVVTAWSMHVLTVIHIAPPDGASHTARSPTRS